MDPIVIENLHKSYGKVHAVKGVSLNVNPGEIFGLIGPDGAGKTTIIRILVSLLNADKGTVLFKGKVVGENITFVRSHIGYMPQRFSLYQDLTVEENMDFFGDLFKVPRKEQIDRKAQLYEFSRLEPFKKRRAGALSGGMKQKLALSCMLIHEPDVIVLDEPTFGVDPVSRSEFWDILKNLSGNGSSILVTTAYMDEATLCDRVSLIYEGRILASDTPDNLTRAITDPLYLISSDNPHLLFAAIQKDDVLGRCELFGDGIHLTDSGNVGGVEIERRIKSLNIPYKEVSELQPHLEDFFFKLIDEAGSL